MAKNNRSEAMKASWARRKAVATVQEVKEFSTNGKVTGGYAVVKVKFGDQWRKIFFKLVEE